MPEPKHSGPQKAPFGNRKDIIAAFSQAWKNGNTFAIEMRNEGDITVRIRNKPVAYFHDPEQFAKAIFPEAVIDD